MDKLSRLWNWARQTMQRSVKQGKNNRVSLYIILGLATSFLVVWGTSHLWQLVKDENKPTFVVEVVKTIATIVGGFAVYINIKQARENTKQAQERLITERFTKAIEQLGNDKLEVRLGGIYALERIAKDSDKDHWTIMEVLTSFVQEKSPLQPNKNNQEEHKTFVESFLSDQGNSHREEAQKIATDVQAALTVIGRRSSSQDPKGNLLDLSNTNLIGANLTGANLSQAKLIGADLSRSNLIGANLTGADLYRAKLIEANLIKAKLIGTVLLGADLSKAFLIGADLGRSDLSGANLSGSDLLKAKLSAATLWHEYWGAADLREVKGLTPEQVKVAKAESWSKALYDEDLHEKLGLPLTELRGEN